MPLIICFTAQVMESYCIYINHAILPLTVQSKFITFCVFSLTLFVLKGLLLVDYSYPVYERDINRTMVLGISLVPNIQ